MNFIKHFLGWVDIMANDERLTPFHVSLYITLFHYWNLNRFKNPISISRSETMQTSKIGSVNTYYKCLKDLHEWSYIQYDPSHNPQRGSKVYLFEFDTTPSTTNDTTGDITVNQQMIPSINNTNIINNKLAYEQSNEITNSDFDRIESEEENNLSGSSGRKQKNKTGGGRAAMSLPASVLEAQTFFEEEKSTKLEAEKFFNYFQSNGWKVGGRAPMKDWRAAARNWILNEQKFAPKQQASKLHATIEKDYGEPL